jgi:cobalt/nickel transport protein
MLFACSTTASAHFQLIYTPEVNVEKPVDLSFKLIFWHPMTNGHVMDMGAPEEFFVLFKGKRTDLKDTLEPITFHGAGNEAKAYEATAKVKRNGDYVFVVIPAPYYEQSEDKYIQQIAKSYVNKGGAPTGWREAVGLPTEIVPLNKPYGVMAGSTFSGIVLSEGTPVPGAEIEIEYMAAEPDMAANRPQPMTAEPIPGGAIVAISDASGVFTFGIPRAGFWGFAALEVGPATEHRGKPLSQDAVIWIRAHELK